MFLNLTILFKKRKKDKPFYVTRAYVDNLQNIRNNKNLFALYFISCMAFLQYKGIVLSLPQKIPSRRL